MHSLLTPTRAVLAVLVLSAVLLFAGVALYTSGEQARARANEGAEIAAAASGLAAALDPGSNVEAVLDEVVRRENLVGAFFLDAAGRVATQRSGRRLDGIDWAAAVLPSVGTEAGDVLVQRSWQGVVYWTASSPTVDGRRVVLLREATAEAGPVGGVLAVAGLLWLLVAAASLLVLRLSRRPADQLVALARDLARPEGMEGMELVNKKFEMRPLLGERAAPLFEMASELHATRRRAQDAQTLANAFLQVGPHYTVLITMDGRVLDANPAFFARTNMMPEWLRGQPLGVLEDILPMEPLLELAERSKRENAAISGVPYALHADGKRRAVDVALRTFETAEGDTVLIVLSDLTRQRTLEHQIGQYSDALDLMVDQRVAELTAGRDDLDGLLDSAGVAVVTFDRAGETKRFNAGAERLTGRTAFTMRRFEQLAQALFPEPARREAFAAWFWSASDAPLRMRTQTPQGERPLLWVCGEHRQAGEAVQRLLVGIGLPASAGWSEGTPNGRSMPAEHVRPLDPAAGSGGDGSVFHDEPL